MKSILLLLFSTVLLLSCGNSKKTTENTVIQSNIEIAVEILYVGVVEIDTICGPIIKVQTATETKSFAPSNFDERYKKSGMKIRFGTEDKLEFAKKCGEHFIVKVTRMTPLR